MDSRNSPTRRSVLKGIGMTGVTMTLAGCGGNETTSVEENGNSGNTNTQATDETTQGGGTPVEQTWKGVLPNPGNEGQHNPWGENYNFDGFYLYDFLARYHDNRDEFIGFLSDNWSIEGTTATIHLRDTYTWHNGDPVTADDLITQLDIEALMGNPFDTVDSWEKTGERTVKFTLSEQANKFMLKDQLLRRRLQAKTSIYGEFAERARNAPTVEGGKSEEEQQIIEDLRQMEMQLGGENHPIGNGPWKFKDGSNQGWTFELYEDYDNGHFSADERNFNQAGWVYLPDKSKRTLALANGDIDYWTKTHPTKAQIEQQPDTVKYNKSPLYNGYGLVANFNKKPWDDRRVRQALLYTIDFDLMAQNTQGAYQRDRIEVPCGISNSALDTYLGDAQDQYLTYEKDLDKATQLLQDAGFSKENEKWIKPSGEEFAPTIKEGRGGYWVSLGQNATSQLSEFGIDAEFRKIGHTEMYGEAVPNGDFEIIGDWWSGLWGRAGYPGFHIRNVTLGWWADQTGYPSTVEIPMPVGEPTGTEETVDVATLFEELSTTQDQEEEQRIIEKIAWVYNMTLPKMPITVEHDINLFETKNWKMPPLDSELMQQPEPHWWADRMGELQARTE